MDTLRRGVYRLAASGAALLVTVLASSAGADDPVSSNVRFNREIIRILQRRCVACHSPGGLSMPLTNYRDVRDWGRAIREEVVDERMPPVTAAAGYGRFQNALGLTQRETATLLTWLDGGMPRGDEKDLPPPLDFTDGTSDAPAGFRVEIPPQQIPALEELVVRRITIASPFTSDRPVTRVDVRPGSRAVLRGALVYQGEAWLGGWLPWQHAFPAPVSRAFVIRKDVPLTLVLYYRGAEEPTTDRSALELHAAEDTAMPVETLKVSAAGGRVGEHVLPAATTIWALQPTTGAAIQSVELRARRPDGAVDVLLWIPTARSEWPSMLVLEEPATLPAKTVLTLHARGASSEQDSALVAISAWPASSRPR